MNKKFKCIKGVADECNVICLQGDIVEIYAIDENEITVKGIFGWCAEHEVTFTAKEFASSFCVWIPEPVIIG
jgi:hypothetical protein